MKKIFFAAVAATLLSTGIGHAADLGGVLLKVGSDTTYPPMETVDPTSGQIVGFDVDLVNAICEKINCKAEFITTAWDGIFASLESGDFDLVASGVSITDDRKKTMDFTDPYLVVSQSILVRIADESLTLDAIKSGGHKLAAQTGTTNAQLADELIGRDNVALYDTFTGAIQALKAGDVSGVVIDGTTAAAYEKEFAGELIAGINNLASDPLGYVFRKGDANVEAFNEGLAAVKADGTLDKLTAKYWGPK